MSDRKFKGYVTEDGRPFVIDPSFTLLPYIEHLQPGFQINSDPPPPGYRPKITAARQPKAVGVDIDSLKTIPDQQLEELHQILLKGAAPSGSSQDLSLLDVAVELASRAFGDCCLCGWECHVNRFERRGRCGLLEAGYYASVDTHIAEEGPITPAVVTNVAGCALRCMGCQASDILSVPPGSRELGPDLWADISKIFCVEQAISLEFVGGNPSENALGILFALQCAPKSFRLPIAWNTHGYETDQVYSFLEEIVDLYVPDWKFGPGDCCESIAGIKNYWSFASRGIQRIVQQDAKIIVRILVLPGHMECCHRPALEWLSTYRDRLWISLTQFIPMWRALDDPKIGRYTSQVEMDKAERTVHQLGMKTIEESKGRFWL
jgi:putative pyruvate formate lyase activating enzyme